MSTLAQIHERFCFAENRWLPSGLAVIATLESFLKGLAYTRAAVPARLTDFETIAIAAFLIFFVVLLAAAPCQHERALLTLFVLNFLFEFFSRSDLMAIKPLVALNKHYLLISMLIWVAISATATVAALGKGGPAGSCR